MWRICLLWARANGRRILGLFVSSVCKIYSYMYNIHFFYFCIQVCRIAQFPSLYLTDNDLSLHLFTFSFLLSYLWSGLQMLAQWNPERVFTALSWTSFNMDSQLRSGKKTLHLKDQKGSEQKHCSFLNQMHASRSRCYDYTQIMQTWLDPINPSLWVPH